MNGVKQYISRARKACAKCTIKHLGQAWSRAIRLGAYQVAFRFLNDIRDIEHLALAPDCAAAELLARACIQAREAKRGYPNHYWLALGHMAEAEEELIGLLPLVAEKIRLFRLRWEEDISNIPPFDSLISLVAASARLLPVSKTTQGESSHG